MVSKDKIDLANSVSALDIVDFFGYDIKRNKISCPLHEDVNPSCSYLQSKGIGGIFHCFSCGANLDTIQLYMELSNLNGKPVSFPEAVNDILEIGELEDIESHTVNTQQKKRESTGNGELYDRVLQNCKPMQNYELQYLANRGIFINGAYVFEGHAYLKSSVDYHIRTAKYEYERKHWQTIKNCGSFYQGISSSFLKANNIEILHNYYGSTNYIVYKIEYEEDEFIFDDDVQRVHANLDESGQRRMLIQKSISDDLHIKRNIGMTDFTLLVNDVNDNQNIYVCEGLEDALSVVQFKNCMAISLNSTSNLKSLINAMKENPVSSILSWHICLDHDQAGQDGTNTLIFFFESENQKFMDAFPQLAKKVKESNGGKVICTYPYYNYDVYDYPMEYKDINEYYCKSIMFGE